MNTTKIFDFPLFEQKQKTKKTILVFVLRRNKKCLRNIYPPPPSAKFARVAYITMHCPLSEATTASRKVISMQMVHKILSGRC